MNDKHLREFVEIVGVISIVAALLLVAWEIHEANRLAAADIEIRLDHGFDELNLRRATTPDFAKLFPKLSAPENHLVTATEESQIEGLAQHLLDICYSAQVAHDRGLIDPRELESYRQDLMRTLDRLPGLIPAMLRIHESNPAMRTMPVFQPLRVLEAQQSPASNDGARISDQPQNPTSRLDRTAD